MIDKKRFVSILDEVETSIRFLAKSGWQGFDCSQKSIETMNTWKDNQTKKKETLEQIREDIGDCKRCKLFQNRKNIVFGFGNPKARLVFIGEGPGYEEDQQGLPFVGAAGQLLTKIIQAMDLTRNQVYICNIIKCRPQGNRNPEPGEIEICSPFLNRQIMAIKPDFICALGNFAAKTLLKTDDSISKIRGRFYDYGDIKLLPTYHPAYLLRNPNKKRDVWEDMKKLIKEMAK